MAIFLFGYNVESRLHLSLRLLFGRLPLLKLWSAVLFSSSEPSRTFTNGENSAKWSMDALKCKEKNIKNKNTFGVLR